MAYRSIYNTWGSLLSISNKQWKDILLHTTEHAIERQLAKTMQNVYLKSKFRNKVDTGTVVPIDKTDFRNR